MGRKVNCHWCGIEFDVGSSRPNAKYCSRVCYTHAQNSEQNIQRVRKKIVCLNCGKEKEIANYVTQRFCSTKCFGEYESTMGVRRERRIKLSEVAGTTSKFLRCLNCGKEFRVFNYRKNTATFCSSKCYDDYRRDFLVCPSCKNLFVVGKWEQRKYCSQSCAVKGMGKRKSRFFLSVFNHIYQHFDVDLKYEYVIKTSERKVYTDLLINNILIVECYGDYWHCNPLIYDASYYHSKIRKTAKDIWEYDEIRKLWLESQSYQVLVLWENDWVYRSHEVLTLIRDTIEGLFGVRDTFKLLRRDHAICTN